MAVNIEMCLKIQMHPKVYSLSTLHAGDMPRPFKCCPRYHQVYLIPSHEQSQITRSSSYTIASFLKNDKLQIDNEQQVYTNI